MFCVLMSSSSHLFLLSDVLLFKTTEKWQESVCVMRLRHDSVSVTSYREVALYWLSFPGDLICPDNCPGNCHTSAFSRSRQLSPVTYFPSTSSRHVSPAMTSYILSVFFHLLFICIICFRIK